MRETAIRSFIKTLSWRIFGIIITFLAAFFLSNELRFALQITAWREIIASILYFTHERCWNKIRLGKREIKN